MNIQSCSPPKHASRMLHITCHPGTEGGDRGGKTRTPLFLRGTTDCILVHIPGAHHVACPHRYLCKPPHDIPVRLVSTACHDLILPDVDRAIFHAEVKLSNGFKCILALRASYGPTLISLPKIGPVLSYSNEFWCATPDQGQRGCQLAAARTKQTVTKSAAPKP